MSDKKAACIVLSTTIKYSIKISVKKLFGWLLPFTRFLAALASPNSASWHPEGLVLLLLDLVGDLVAEEDQVGAALDHVGDQVLVLRLQLRRVLEDVLRVLVRHLLRVVSWVLHLNTKMFISGQTTSEDGDHFC